MVNALAGTGKTSTGVWGLGARVPRDVRVSDEQKAIIKLMRTYTGSQAAMAFNRSIADKLKEEAPKSCVCNTSNGFGHQAWANHLNMKLGMPDNLKNRKICRELIGQRFPWKERIRIESAVDGIVGLCKSYLFDPHTSERKNWLYSDVYTDGHGAMLWLCDRFDIDNDPVVLEYAVKTFIKGVEPNAFIDWDDQIFLPLYHDISLPQYDHVMFDESQDANRAKMELAFRMAKNLTAFGDRNQAIYGFAGADSEAMQNMWIRMQQLDSSATMLPLTITRRNPKKVVELANQLVPELKARPDAPEGIVENMTMDKFHKSVGDIPSMVVCRVNAPLSSLAFKLLSQGKRCYIQGRDIGAGLKSEIKRTGENELSTALSIVHDRIERRKIEILQREFPDENQIEALNDKLACIDILAGDADTIEEFNGIVDRLFKDSGDKKDTRLSSIHKAKGLEHPIVHVYMSNKLMQNFTRKGRKKQVFQDEQEKNLAYVAYTRSMSELYRIPEEKKEREYYGDT